MTTLAHCRAPVFLNVNSNQNATYCSLKHHSKRVTSLIGVITGDIAIFINIDWTSVTACERIVVEMQLSYEEKTNKENIHEGTLNVEKR